MQSGAKQPIQPLISVIGESDLNRAMDGPNLYVIGMRYDSIQAVCVEMNAWIDRSAPTRQEAARQHPRINCKIEILLMYLWSIYCMRLVCPVTTPKMY